MGRHYTKRRQSLGQRMREFLFQLGQRLVPRINLILGISSIDQFQESLAVVQLSNEILIEIGKEIRNCISWKLINKKL